MEEISFDFEKYLYPKAILPAIEIAEEEANKDFCGSVDFGKNFSEAEYKAKLSKLYKEKREWLKEIYFSNFTEEKLLDLHKIAAVLCRCIIKLKPFAFDTIKASKYIESHNKNKETDWVIDNYLINYKVAYNVALNVTLYDLFNRLGEIEDGKPLKKSEIKRIFKRLSEDGLDEYAKGTTLVPIDHEPFYRSQIINLAINDLNKRNFDYLGFATNCFQLQQYTVLKCLVNK